MKFRVNDINVYEVMKDHLKEKFDEEMKGLTKDDSIALATIIQTRFEEYKAILTNFFNKKKT